MGSCNRSCVAAFAAPGKLTFVLNHLSPQSVPDLLQFSQQYIAANNGNVPYKDRSTTIKQGLMVVLPSPVEE
jgi:predicted metal-binding protein